MLEISLPHFNERKAPVDTLVLHATAHETCEEVVACLDRIKLSIHYILGIDGTLCRCVSEENRAWHAGLGSWREIKTDMNSHSVGIEICNPNLGQTPFTEAQLEKLVPFCKKIIRKHKIKPQYVIAHSDMAPTRKPDPGIAFPWKRLAKEGIGLWYQPRNAEKVQTDNVAELLGIIGYNTENQENTIAAAYAFRRHFLPEEVAVDENIGHLVENVYPIGKTELLKGGKFLKTLKAVAYSYQTTNRKIDSAIFEGV